MTKPINTRNTHCQKPLKPLDIPLSSSDISRKKLRLFIYNTINQLQKLTNLFVWLIFYSVQPDQHLIKMTDTVEVAKARRILVAVDEGEESMYALSWALTNLISPKDTILLVHAKIPRVLHTTLDGTGYLFSSDIIATMENYQNDVAQSVIEKARRLCKDLYDAKVETRVENGYPRDVICEVAVKLGVDVLVMGTHGYGMIKRAFLGSVSNHCAQKVKCPVLIVKKPKSAPATASS